jgi:hypothetical protein
MAARLLSQLDGFHASHTEQPLNARICRLPARDLACIGLISTRTLAWKGYSWVKNRPKALHHLLAGLNNDVHTNNPETPHRKRFPAFKDQWAYDRAQHGVAVRPLRARDRAFFDVFLCSALAAAERQTVGRTFQLIIKNSAAVFVSVVS